MSRPAPMPPEWRYLVTEVQEDCTDQTLLASMVDVVRLCVELGSTRGHDGYWVSWNITDLLDRNEHGLPRMVEGPEGQPWREDVGGPEPVTYEVRTQTARGVEQPPPLTLARVEAFLTERFPPDSVESALSHLADDAYVSTTVVGRGDLYVERLSGA